MSEAEVTFLISLTNSSDNRSAVRDISSGTSPLRRLRPYRFMARCKLASSSVRKASSFSLLGEATKSLSCFAPVTTLGIYRFLAVSFVLNYWSNEVKS